ncbi:pyridoxal-phosphate dependent enzyme [Nitrosospira multiformis]|uniref:L-serine ammonia-lyase n=1 Tax=Nitrosospira multiformis (strain ATCC 25196 / NCIMB 11849 / C 71) TaxID=323848 RepID=Q2YC73_NITMU|nr:pyridoxal-phosphate dependent enzyme [Nitrosospira multiformis]ABB73648.1 L-serine ammonia-lyase [Nitrosospira multiformis ATCC 25196]SDZ76142.1 L-serine ammonia-lyase [Nitrosospira multiformis]SEF39338.1 L-serine ammonia-lyase [Nitrosospira multiformis ATCC 25196]
MPLHIQTPLIESRPLSDRTGHSVWLKMEIAQPSGSFKARGIGYACEEYFRRGAKRFISSSGGNAGLAVAFAGRNLSVPVVIVVPETASKRARELMAREGAEVIIQGKSLSEANAFARSLVQPEDAFLHPFDDPLIWTGHASIIDEIVDTGPKPDVIVLSVGGGGLLCGVIEGLNRNEWQDVPIIAVETQGADSFAQALNAGALVELPRISSIATTLGASAVCRQALEYSRKHRIGSVVLPDKLAVSACMQFLRDHDAVVEPACGVALAAVYERVPALSGYKKVLIIVCGGVSTTVDQLQEWSAVMQ